MLGPVEVGAVLTSAALAFLRRHNRPAFAPTALAAVLFATVLIVFFLLVAPVNAAFATWTADTIPVDWTAYRLRWEWGHTIRGLLAFGALGGLAVAAQRDRCA